MKDVIDSLRPADAAAVADSLADQRQTVSAPNDNIGAVIVGQVQAMQNALKEDQELVVLCYDRSGNAAGARVLLTVPARAGAYGTRHGKNHYPGNLSGRLAAVGLQADASPDRHKTCTYSLCGSQA